MNIVLLPQHNLNLDTLRIDDARQLSHLKQHLNLKQGDLLKVGVWNHARYLTEVVEAKDDAVTVKILNQQDLPQKLPVTLIIALPRPKVLRRLIMDAVTLGVQKIVLLHSYRVDKSYWQTPFLNKIDEYVQLGLEQAGDVIAPEIILEQRFKPFVEDRLAVWTQLNPTFVGHPYADVRAPVAFNQPCQLMIGPEGGFIPYEIDMLEKNGCQTVTLGNRILRTETAMPYLLGRLFTF